MISLFQYYLTQEQKNIINTFTEKNFKKIKKENKGPNIEK